MMNRWNSGSNDVSKVNEMGENVDRLNEIQAYAGREVTDWSRFRWLGNIIKKCLNFETVLI